MKQGKENFEIAKDPKNKKDNYIFQKNGITKSTAIFIIIVLVLLVAAVAYTGYFF